VTTRVTVADALERPLLRDPPGCRWGRGRVAGWLESSTVPLEQMGQSAVKRLWRQKRLFTDVAE
jgi:hypothetical protein